MPHKRTVDRVEAPPDLVPTLRALAKALGVTDDTLTQWRRRGLAIGGSAGWSITGTYLAARRAGLKPRLPDDARLVEIIQAGMKGIRAQEFDDDDGETIELPGVSAYDPMFKRHKLENRTHAILREQLIGEELKNAKLRDQLEEARGKLVTREQATAAAAQVRDNFIALGKRLWPKVDSTLPDTVPASQRQELALALSKAWDELLAELAL